MLDDSLERKDESKRNTGYLSACHERCLSSPPMCG